MVEEALAGLSGRLIDAQEEERKRIAREIHDDYTQQLVVVAMDLEGLAEEVGDSPVGAGQRFREIWNQISEARRRSSFFVTQVAFFHARESRSGCRGEGLL